MKQTTEDATPTIYLYALHRSTNDGLPQSMHIFTPTFLVLTFCYPIFSHIMLHHIFSHIFCSRDFCSQFFLPYFAPAACLDPPSDTRTQICTYDRLSNIDATSSSIQTWHNTWHKRHVNCHVSSWRHRDVISSSTKQLYRQQLVSINCEHWALSLIYRRYVITTSLTPISYKYNK